MTTGTPSADFTIDEALVRALLRDQHPDFADAAIQRMDNGWDNAMYRLDEHHVVRLPRRAEAVALAEHEQRWLPVLAPRLPIPIPLPVRAGRPSSLYPWTWSIVPWLPGSPADLACPAADQARPLADFLRALHQPAPPAAPQNPFRGVPLCQRADIVEERFQRLRSVSDLITPGLLRTWKRALEAPESGEPCWLHGDLHARNVLVNDGTITGIVDWGDLTAGDAATDLAAAWMLFREPEARRVCLDHYRAPRDLRARAKGWVVFFGTVLLETGLVDNPRHAAMGEATLRRLAVDS
jgi:aminoglycoside phosphotransferase (APT) family kinase protein